MQQASIYAEQHEPLDRNRLHAVAISFYKDKGGAVDAYTSTMKNAVAQLFMVLRFYHATETQGPGIVIKELSGNGNGGLEPLVEFRKREF